MKFEEGIEEKYRKAVEDAVDTIIEKGNDSHRTVAKAIRDSEMLIRVEPVSEVNASGVTGVINWWSTNRRIANEKLSVNEALAQIYIMIAKETIDAGPRGIEGTFVHEGRHAYDFAQVIASFSDSDLNPLSVFDPTMYELELAAHIAAGEYMLLVNKDEYIAEGLDLLILGRDGNGAAQLWDEGIKVRLRDGYNLTSELDRQGVLASELLKLAQR
jgi:hypothetical protein